MTSNIQNTPRLEVTGLSRKFAGRTVVDDVSLTVMPGQVTCLLGPSGCGKSTTLRMIAGIESPHAGRISIDGTTVCGEGVSTPPERRNIGMMFQDFALFPHLTVGQNVGFGLKTSRDAARAQVEATLSRVDLSRFIDVYPDSLSGGEQQRVALARAIAPRPGVMLMDEPFSGLDNRLRDGIRDETLQLLKEDGTAVLLVTHEPEEAMRMADQIALMREGQIVQKGAPYNAYSHPVDKAAMAFFSEVNSLKATVHSGSVDTAFGHFLTPGLQDGQAVEIAFRPQYVRIDFNRAEAEATAPHQTTPARAEVLRARFLGQESLVEFRLVSGGDVVKVTVPGVFLPEPGALFLLRAPRDKCFIFPMD